MTDLKIQIPDHRACSRQEPGMTGQVENVLRKEPAPDPNNPVMVPGDPEKMFFKKRINEGIPVPQSLMKKYCEITGKYKLEVPWISL